MATNHLYEMHSLIKSDSPDTQTISTEPESTVQTDPPQHHLAPQQVYCVQQPNAGQGYTPGYKKIVNPPQTSTSTNVVMSSQQHGIIMRRPDNYLCMSVFTTFFCCPVFGILALIKGAQVDSAFDRGDCVRAEAYSLSAKKYVLVAIVAGIFGMSFLGIVYYQILL